MREISTAGKAPGALSAPVIAAWGVLPLYFRICGEAQVPTARIFLTASTRSTDDCPATPDALSFPKHQGMLSGLLAKRGTMKTEHP
jgi:hypothetical protein